MKILIADDNELNRWLLAEQMQGFDATAVQVANGQQAWDILRADSFVLVFLDVNMPLISGLELIGKIRAHAALHTLFCVAVTAHAQPGQRQKLLQHGFDDCLIKPILLADLQRIVSRFQPQVSAIDADTYAGILLRRVEGNRDLAQLLLNRLFEQVPEQFEQLQHLLADLRFLDAWEVAHQMHGTFCFFGFEDFRARALVLEQSLLHVTDGGDDAGRQLAILQSEFALLMDKQAVLMGLMA